MMERRQGKIVSIASIVGLVGGASRSAYSAGKAGLQGLMVAMTMPLHWCRWIKTPPGTCLRRAWNQP